MSNIAAALGLEHHHPIMSKLYGHGYKTNRQTYRQTTSFDKNFDHLSMNNSFEVEKFEPEPTFEKLSMRSKLIIGKLSTPLT